MSNTMNSSIGGTYDPPMNTITVTAPTSAAAAGAQLTSPGVGVWTGTAHAAYINPSTYNVTFSVPQIDIIKLHDMMGKEIVKLTNDGEVVWADPAMDENAAAQALSRSLQYSAELKSGITKKVKSDMRDTVFEEIIKIAEQKGSLTADDLTYLLEASKIIEKLKGG